MDVGMRGVDVERFKSYSQISMMVLCNDIVITEYGGRRLGLPNQPEVMEQYNDRDHRAIYIALNL